MQVFDEIKQRMVDVETTRRVVIHQYDSYLIYGYVSKESNIVECSLCIKDQGWIDENVLYDTMREFLFYSTLRGGYVSRINIPVQDYIKEKYSMRKMSGDSSAYSFTRGSRPTYEAIDRFSLFRGKQRVVSDVPHKLAEFFPYTFGLEFETSQGCVPEPLCFRDGLIPLRDGSISGYEYSTVVLKGNEGLQLLQQQVESLKAFTAFDKECSLHIHIGGYPQNPDYIFRVYHLCKCLEKTIATLVPPLTFKSREYKANEKDYCKQLKSYDNFQNLYYAMTGTRYFGSLVQGHPQDIERKRKWQITSRYYWCNVINAICYNVNKTIEFRLLRPTYNYKKIVLWLYIFNAIMQYADINDDPKSYNSDLILIFRAVYPEHIVTELEKGVALLQVLRETQTNNNDLCGQQVQLEDRLFTEELDI